MPEPDRYRALDGLRGLAATFVALMHLKVAHTPVTDNPLVDNSALFVDLFFVLSGFVISHAYLYGGELRFARFAVYRLARLYPLHLCVLLVFVPFELIKYAFYGHGLVGFNSEPFS